MDNKVFVVKDSTGEEIVGVYASFQDARNTAEWLDGDLEQIEVKMAPDELGYMIMGWVEFKWNRLEGKASQINYNVSRPMKIVKSGYKEVNVDRYKAAKVFDDWSVEISYESSVADSDIKEKLESGMNILVANLGRCNGCAGLEEDKFNEFCNKVEEEINRVV